MADIEGMSTTTTPAAFDLLAILTTPPTAEELAEAAAYDRRIAPLLRRERLAIRAQRGTATLPEKFELDDLNASLGY